MVKIHTVPIKAFSVNKCFYGKKMSTKGYIQYKIDLEDLLPEEYNVPKGQLGLYIDFGLSHRGNDIDNGAKPFIDALQRKFKFNDNRIYSLLLKKTIVPRGSEFIKFALLDLETHENKFVSTGVKF